MSGESSPATWPRLSFIIPVFNEEAVIARKLQNTLSLVYPGELEVIVVDDGSNDSTPVILKTLERTETRLFSIRNRRLGKAQALRTGIEVARGELIVISDADAFLNKVALVDAAKVLTNYPKVGCVSGVITSKQGNAGLFHKLGESIRVLESQIWTASHPAGVFACFRRELVNDFTESSSTDLDIGLRVIQKGFTICVLDSIKCEHYSPSTFSKEYISSVVRPFVGRIHALRKYHSLFFRKNKNLFETFILLRYLVLPLFEPFAFFTFSVTSLWLLFQVFSEAIIPSWVILLFFIVSVTADFSSKNIFSKVILRRAIFYGAEIIGLIRYAIRGPYTKWQMSRRGQKIGH